MDDLLLRKYHDYICLKNCKAEYQLSSGLVIDFIYKEENFTTLTYTDAVINFNPTLIKSKIKSNYLLFEKKSNGEYNHLGIAEDSIKKTIYRNLFSPTNRYVY